MVHRVRGRLSRTTFNPLFWVLFALYIGHQGWRWLALPRPGWIQFYLDDLLCLPLVLTISLFVLRFFYGIQRRLSFYQVAFTILYFTLVFEVFLPKFMPRYTGDWIDGVLYAAGGLIFYWFQDRSSA